MVLPEDIDILVIGQSKALATRLCRMVGRSLSGHYQPCDESGANGFLVANRYMVLILGNASGFSPGFLETIQQQQPQARFLMFETDIGLHGPLLDQQASRINMDLVSVLPLPCPPERLEAVVERLNTATLEHAVDRAPMSLDEVGAAVEAQKIRAWYQPKVRLSDGQVVGFEALARWLEPDGTMLPPRLFIPTAEDSELIIPITRKLITDSLTELSDWQSQGFNLKVSVNATVEVLNSRNFIDWLDQSLSHHQLSPSSLVIEITESRVAGKATKIVEHLTQLRQLGVGVSVDDFGTGYSSLLQLSRMPCTELKIDRSFVSGASVKEERGVLLRNSVSIGHGLGLNVVAEGVETRADWEAAARAGTDEVQGWFIGKAQPAERVLTWLEDWETRRALLVRETRTYAEAKNPKPQDADPTGWRQHQPSRVQLAVLVLMMVLSAGLALLF